jgi:hypothetical protein
MWSSHVHVLKPLMDQSGMKKATSIQWIDVQQAAFALTTYPDHNIH